VSATNARASATVITKTARFRPCRARRPAQPDVAFVLRVAPLRRDANAKATRAYKSMLSHVQFGGVVH
jgi:hypothetical protein